MAVLDGLRHPHGRFGEPRVFVGTAADAMYLRFRAVRILGAVEGAIPGRHARIRSCPMLRARGSKVACAKVAPRTA